MAGGYAPDFTKMKPNQPQHMRRQCQALKLTKEEIAQHFQKSGRERGCIKNAGGILGCRFCEGKFLNWAFMFDQDTKAWRRLKSMSTSREGLACSLVETDDEKVRSDLR